MHSGLSRKLTKLKKNNILIKYFMYAFFSLCLGILLKFKVLDEIFISVNSFINILINILGLKEYILIPTEDNCLSLISTSAAILTTIFTLIFVLTALYVQMLNKFTSLNIFSIKETKILMIIYFGTIILSLIMLETNYKCPTFILIMTVFCVLSIYPFMQSVNSKLMYSGREKLITDIKILINASEEDRAISIIDDFANIHKNIINDKQNNFSYMDILYCDNICMFAQKQKMGEVISRIGSHYFDILSILIGSNLEFEQKNIRVGYVLSGIRDYTEKYLEIKNYLGLEGQVIFLNTHGAYLIKEGFKDSNVRIIADCLYNCFNVIQRKRISGELNEKDTYILEKYVITYIGELASESSYERLKFTVNTSVQFLLKIGAEVIWATEKNERPNKRILFTVVDQLRKIEDAKGEVFKRIFEDSKSEISDYQEVNPYLDQFERFYYETRN